MQFSYATFSVAATGVFPGLTKKVTTFYRWLKKVFVYRHYGMIEYRF
jgi:hypothetical protein